MHPTIAPVANQYKLQTQVMNMLLNDVTEEQAWKRPSDNSNAVHWILGHITSTRYSIAKMLGNEDEMKGAELFGRGSEIKDKSEYPSYEELKSAFNAISEKVHSLLESAGEEQLNSKAPFEAPAQDDTLRGCLAFLAFHESYHLGQISYVRRLHGLDRTFG